ncbi:hypothetical protein DL93DRAFT_2056216 [Clavulina sp. PMI_390]|nr:hypothetical protein DL93DRAFT_2056216 [Clavulina sp. PMI_390]
MPSSSSSAPRNRTVMAPRATQTGALRCSLPPTCSGYGKELSFKTAADMERHHATYHTHTCLEAGCGTVFPDARYLSLHQAECHDPLTAIRKERGEKTFQCFVETCTRKFSTPKTRRLHLIEAHGYPAEFFFAITNRGVGGLLERWGEGASLIRGKWKERPDPSGHDDDEMAEDVPNKVAAATPPERLMQPRSVQRPQKPAPPKNTPSNLSNPGAPKTRTSQTSSASMDVDDLTSTMTSLSLVPRSIHFGRGKPTPLGNR